MLNSIWLLRLYLVDDILQDVPERHEGESKKETQGSTKLRDEGVVRIAVDFLHHCHHVR